MGTKREINTIEDFNRAMEENENFHGRKLNDGKLRAVNQLQDLAERIAARSTATFKASYEVELADQSHRNCYVFVDINAPASIPDKITRNLLAQMIIISESMVISEPEGANKVRFFFSIEDVWE